MITAEELITITEYGDVLVGGVRVGSISGYQREKKEKERRTRLANIIRPAIAAVWQDATLEAMKDCPISDDRLTDLRKHVDRAELQVPGAMQSFRDLLAIIDHQKAVIALMARDQS